MALALDALHTPDTASVLTIPPCVCCRALLQERERRPSADAGRALLHFRMLVGVKKAGSVIGKVRAAPTATGVAQNILCPVLLTSFDLVFGVCLTH